jgi:3D (Asp-Asp-Asp) domain-containing protein
MRRINLFKFIRFLIIIGCIIFIILFFNSNEKKRDSSKSEIGSIKNESSFPIMPRIRTSRGSLRTLEMKATAYDLSFESCGKYQSDLEYGITKSGTKATVRRTIAVDPEIIKLGSRVYLEFTGSDSFRNGTYIAEDTGLLVKNNVIDIYLGKDVKGENWVHKAVHRFGVKDVKVTILN